MPRKKNGPKSLKLPMIATVFALVSDFFSIKPEEVKSHKEGKKFAIFLMKELGVPVKALQQEFGIKYNSQVYAARNWVLKRNTGEVEQDLRRMLKQARMIHGGAAPAAEPQAVSSRTPSEPVQRASRLAVKTEDDKLVGRICAFVGRIYLHVMSHCKYQHVSLPSDLALYLLLIEGKRHVQELISIFDLTPDAQMAAIGRVIFAIDRDPTLAPLIADLKVQVQFVIEADPEP